MGIKSVFAISVTAFSPWNYSHLIPTVVVWVLKQRKTSLAQKARDSHLSPVCAPACLVVNSALELRLSSTRWSSFVSTLKLLSENWPSLAHSAADICVYWELSTEMELDGWRIHLFCSLQAQDGFASAPLHSLFLLLFFQIIVKVQHSTSLSPCVLLDWTYWTYLHYKRSPTVPFTGIASLWVFRTVTYRWEESRTFGCTGSSWCWPYSLWSIAAYIFWEPWGCSLLLPTTGLKAGF